MEHMNRKYFGIVVSVCIFFMVGCSAERNLIRAIDDPRDGKRYSGEIKEVRELLSSYIGKDSAVLFKDFGPPIEINKNISHGGKMYEEEWYYYYSKGVPLINQNSWAYIFYLNGNTIEDISFL